MSGAAQAADRPCRGCRNDYRVTDEQIARVLAAPMFRSAELCVPDSVYAERLRICAACPQLLGGATCALCGCIVQVAAKLRERGCPDPAGARWSRHER